MVGGGYQLSAGAPAAFTVPMLRTPQEERADAAVLTELTAACRDSRRLRFA